MAKIELLNTIFDRDNDNVLKFNNKKERDDYFANINEKIVFENINFIANDLINTQIELNVNGLTSLFKLLNYNYCIVTQEDEKLFYFVERSAQLDGSLITLDLRCDIFQTYYYDINNLQGLITRTHLDRFVKKGDLWKFNNDLNSPLFEKENLSFSKRPTRLQKLYQKCANEELENWLKENVEYWNYYFLSPGVYNAYTANRKKIDSDLPNIFYDYGESGKLVCLVEPHYKRGANKIGITYNTTDVVNFEIWDESGIELFLEANNGYANVVAIKSSIVSPFSSQKAMGGPYSIDSRGNLIIDTTWKINEFSAIFPSGTIDSQTVVFVTYTGDAGTIAAPTGVMKLQDVEDFVLKCDGDFFKDTFEVDDISNDTEPKLYSENVSEYNVFIGGQSYKMPCLKTNKTPVFKYYEPLTPDITKAILTYSEELTSGEEGKIFTTINESDYTGFAVQIDLSKWFTTNNLDTFLANNKNNLQIFNNTQSAKKESAMISGAQGLLATGASLASGNYAGALSSGVSTIAGGINTEIQLDYERKNYNLTLDNMAQAPEQLSVVNSNIALVNAVSGLSMYIELQEPIPFEQAIFVDNMKIMGYNYGKLGTVSELAESRKYYNYIEATIYEVDGNFAEQIKDSIKSIFKKGVRMWHYDYWTGAIDYNLNNIERSVLNGE